LKPFANLAFGVETRHPVAVEIVTLPRRWAWPNGFELEQHEVRAEAWVALRMRQVGARAFDFRPAQAQGWSRLFFVAEGSLAANGAPLEPGRWHPVPFGVPCVSSHQAVLWMVAVRGPAPTALLRNTDPTSSAALEALLRGLASTAQARPDTGTSQFASLVASLTSRLEDAPTSVDLSGALQLDDRRTSEVAARYFSRFHATVGGWRDYLRAIRLELALSAFSAGKSTRDVARWLGFRNATALLHSMKKAALPTPSALRAAEQQAASAIELCALLRPPG
jgi:methylphosphotriester-DNA--protein-cysteine methyltransferase